MRIGMICPYSFDEPGGVQIHAIELCAELRRRGHYVSLIGPGTDRAEVPDFVELGGSSIPIRYNGSVARLSFGPRTIRHLRRWLRKHEFDLVHIHEPNSPSYSMLALTQARGPIVATYHASASESRLLKLVLPVLRPLLDNIHGGIAVSEQARRWQVENVAGNPVLIPNGVDTRQYRQAVPMIGDSVRPRLMFLGRFDEPRKGLQVLLQALPMIMERAPDVEVMIAGAGSVDGLGRRLDRLGISWSDRPGTDATVWVMGRISDQDKASALASCDVYVAPNTSGESFGIILVEAMAAGAAVIASDIPAFRAVGCNGKAAALFPNEDSAQLAARVCELLADPDQRHALAARGRTRSEDFDWDTVATRVERVYDAVVVSGRKVRVR